MSSISIFSFTIFDVLFVTNAFLFSFKIGEMKGDSMKVTFDENPRENIPYQMNDLQINGHLTAVTIVVSIVL